MVDKIHTSTGKDDWETPPDFFAKLDAEFNFTLDACAEQATAKCKSYFTKEQNALQQKWTAGRICKKSIQIRIKWRLRISGFIDSCTD